MKCEHCNSTVDLYKAAHEYVCGDCIDYYELESCEDCGLTLDWSDFVVGDGPTVCPEEFGGCRSMDSTKPARDVLKPVEVVA